MAEAAKWRRFFYPGTEVLRNHLNIRDASVLAEVEYRWTSARQRDLLEGILPIEGENTTQRLSSIHHSLFVELYPWAGEFRDVNVQKGGHHFGDSASMGMYLRQADRMIGRFDWDPASFDEKVRQLAELYTHLNFAHPFREGNGRTTRILLTDLAALHDVDLYFAAIGRTEWNQASSDTFLDPMGNRLDSAPLKRLFARISSPLR